MARKDYIEKINQNLEHLTKDELKDVSILTTAQYGVRLKVAEKEYIEKEISNLTPQLQQQALPVVPECVAEYIEECKGNLSLYGTLFHIFDNTNKELNNWVFREANQDLFARAWLDGYTVEKPQLFYIELPKVFGLSDSTFVSKAESGIISEFTKGKDYALKFTEQEIKSIDERYWQFAVPAEDGE
ncbi:hypothetical protein LKF67_1304 [Lactococcus lactis subsp. lactis]|uniref:DUF1642 domain-containing protein n=1 Tax=Lactococcus lactis TaxID=1358 RepID=UPI00071E5EE0|nr:DUF1642 domain-containing protein [Lactococcus lactis]KST91521.1 hypothetical protein LKF67_1304 [Lactococcus lactis subsp. lactis]